jgi:hypothetical protein
MLRTSGGAIKLTTDTYEIEEIQNLRIRDPISFTVLNPIEPTEPEILPIDNLIFTNKVVRFYSSGEYIPESIQDIQFQSYRKYLNYFSGGTYEPLSISSIRFNFEPAFGLLEIDYPYPEPEPEQPILGVFFDKQPAYFKLTQGLDFDQETALYVDGNILIPRNYGDIVYLTVYGQRYPANIRIWDGTHWESIIIKVFDGDTWIDAIEYYN